jgi:hypothetical protein
MTKLQSTAGESRGGVPLNARRRDLLADRLLPQAMMAETVDAASRTVNLEHRWPPE